MSEGRPQTSQNRFIQQQQQQQALEKQESTKKHTAPSDRTREKKLGSQIRATKSSDNSQKQNRVQLKRQQSATQQPAKQRSFEGCDAQPGDFDRQSGSAQETTTTTTTAPKQKSAPPLTTRAAPQTNKQLEPQSARPIRALSSSDSSRGRDTLVEQQFGAVSAQRSSDASSGRLSMRVPPLYRPDACGQASGAPAPPHQAQQPPTCAHSASSASQQQHQTHHQRQQLCVQGPPPVGGQRMALKLAAPLAQQHQHQQQQQLKPVAHRWHQPALPHQAHHYGPPRPASPCDDRLDCDDQDSDCSCSNSLDCPLSQQQHHSPPKMGPCRLQHSPLMPNSLMGVEHHQHHTHPPSHQFHQTRRQLHRHPQQQQQHCMDRNEGCAFIDHNPHSFHRPIQGHTSASSGSNSGASPPPPPPPPPLVRQSTYSANSDTITDATLGHHPQQQIPLTPPPPPAMVQGPGGTSDFNPANERINGGHYGTMQHHSNSGSSSVAQPPPPGTGSNGNGGSGNHASKQRQSVSFRRPATATGDHGGALSEQVGVVSKDMTIAHLQEPPLKAAGAQVQSTASLHRQRSAGPKTINSFQVSNDQFRHNTLHTCPTAPPMASLSHSHSGGHHQPQQQPMGQQQQQQQQQPLHHHHHAPGSLSTVYQPSGSPAGGVSQPMRAAAAQLLAATSGASPSFDGAPLPPISSHRTNSPWMRISSIILTPIGIVIILFIVVSPLLHYLM